MKTNQKIKTQKMTIVEKQTNNAQSKREEKGILKENLEPQSIDKNIFDGGLESFDEREKIESCKYYIDKCDSEEKIDTTQKSKEKTKKSKNAFKSFFKYIFLFPVYIYKFIISPLLPHSCIFYPSCSNYMILAVGKFGIFKGFFIGMKRLFRCVPWQKKRGYDPVPLNIKGDDLWIL